MLIKARTLQNLKSIQLDPQRIFIHTINMLNQDVELISARFNLFTPPETLSEKCECVGVTESAEISTKELLELELDKTLILDLFEGVVHYFCKVHRAEKVTQLKDYIIQKPKTFQLRHTLDENPNKVRQDIVQFPCGICAKECIDIIHKKKAAFEDFSVQCDKCDKWYHYICANLSGKEPELMENSDIPYYCVKCTISVDAVAENVENFEITSDPSDHNVQDRNASNNLDETSGNDIQAVCGRAHGHGCGRGRGRGRARGRGRGKNTIPDTEQQCPGNIPMSAQASTSADIYTSISSRGRKRKAVKHDDFVT